MDRAWIMIGAVFGLAAVGAAAAAAHAPAWGGEAMRDAVQMLGWHALALLGTGVWAGRGGMAAHLAGGAFAAGTALFFGAVALHHVAGWATAGVAPVGGVTLMAGWALLAVSALRAR